eukprot:585667-Ditylum_brightwellii.AAC.1
MMEDDEFIPCFAYIEFTLMVSKEAKDNQEFKDLHETTNKIIANCRKSLKAQILKCINVKYKLLHWQIINDFAKSLCFVTKQHLVLLQDTSNINETVSTFLLASKGELMQHLHCNETTLYNAYKRIHSITDFPKLNAQVRNAINAQNNATSQPSQQPATQEEVVEVMNEDPVEDTTASQTHHFTAFEFGMTHTPNLAVPPPPPPPAATTITATPATKDLNDHPCPETTYVNNMTMPLNYTQYTNKVFHIFYNKIVEPLRLTYLNTFIHSWGQFKRHINAKEVKLQLKKLTEKHFVTIATEDTQMLIDEEQNVDYTTLNNLIKKATIEETKQLQLQLHCLTDKLATIKLQKTYN